MAQRPDDLQQEIEQTRGALTEKLDTLEGKANQLFDLRYQATQHPLVSLGAAVAAGYVLGSVEDEERGSGALAQFDNEIAMLKTAATSALIAFLRDSIRAYVPALGRQLDTLERERGPSAASPISSRTSAPMP
jgi:hypothetical protein